MAVMLFFSPFIHTYVSDGQQIRNSVTYWTKGFDDNTTQVGFGCILATLAWGWNFNFTSCSITIVYCIVGK